MCEKIFKRNTGGPEHTNRHQHRTQTNVETEHRPTRTERKERDKQESPPGGRASKREPAKSGAEARHASKESKQCWMPVPTEHSPGSAEMAVCSPSSVVHGAVDVAMIGAQAWRSACMWGRCPSARIPRLRLLAPIAHSTAPARAPAQGKCARRSESGVNDVLRSHAACEAAYTGANHVAAAAPDANRVGVTDHLQKSRAPSTAVTAGR